MLPWLRMQLSGEVIRGRGQATAMFGLPTANLAVDVPQSLHAGVYAAYAMINSVQRPAAAYVSAATPASLEVHIFDFMGDLYGQTLTVEIQDLLSQHVPWESQVQMTAKILADVRLAKKHFGLD
jgi:riboflavin kinase / FMN adenylyltransferase